MAVLPESKGDQESFSGGTGSNTCSDHQHGLFRRRYMLSFGDRQRLTLMLKHGGGAPLTSIDDGSHEDSLISR
jgi:hypothetical protein